MMTTNISKSKRESRFFHRLLGVFSPLHFEFETTFSISECHRLLRQNFNAGSWLHQNHEQCYLQKHDNGVCEFVLKKQLRSSLDLKGKIYLQRNTSSLTRVTGTVAFSKSAYLAMASVVAMGILVFQYGIDSNTFCPHLLVPFIWLVMLIGSLLRANITRNLLLDSLEATLLR